MKSPQKKPGRDGSPGCALPILMVFAAGALAIWGYVDGLVPLIKMPVYAPQFRMVAPGTDEIFLAGGQYELYHDYRSTIDDVRRTNDPSLGSLTVTLHGKQDGGTVKLVPAAVNPVHRQYYDGRATIQVASFTLNDNPEQEYVLEAKYPDGSARPEVVLAIGRSTREFRTKAAMVTCVGGGGAILCVLGAIISFIRPRR